MNNTDLNYSLKRLTTASNTLLECEKEIEALTDKIANASAAVERTAVDLNGAKNLVAVQYCPKCINCSSTLATEHIARCQNCRSETVTIAHASKYALIAFAGIAKTQPQTAASGRKASHLLTAGKPYRP